MKAFYRRGELKDTKQIIILLNKYLSYGLANKENVIGKIINYETYVCEYNQMVVGFISSKNVKEEDFVLKSHEKKSIRLSENDKIITHLVVDESYRKLGIGNGLMAVALENISLDNQVFAVGWIRSNTGKWDAENIFKRFNFIELFNISNYYSRYPNAPCPYCSKYCVCSAKIVSRLRRQ